jgi:hypothetical protein
LLLLLLFLVSLGAYKLSYGVQDLHAYGERKKWMGVLELQPLHAGPDSWTQLNPGGMSHGVGTIKFKSNCNVLWSTQDQIQIQLQCLVD